MGHKPVVRFLSEFIATASLVFFGCMGCIQSSYYPNNHLQMCLNFGMVILINVQVFHTVTGPHMNPAITLAAVVYERVDPAMGGVYMLGQMLGGAVGYALLALLIPEHDINRPLSAHGLCVTVPIGQINLIQAIALEFILTAFLILVCCGIWDPKNAGFGDGVPTRFGFAIFSLACSGGPLTGASMNPARSFGPALWHLDFTDHWVYYVGPMLGAAVASVGYKFTFKSPSQTEEE